MLSDFNSIKVRWVVQFLNWGCKIKLILYYAKLGVKRNILKHSESKWPVPLVVLCANDFCESWIHRRLWSGPIINLFGISLFPCGPLTKEKCDMHWHVNAKSHSIRNLNRTVKIRMSTLGWKLVWRGNFILLKIRFGLKIYQKR